jgi:hypothetical protein
MAVLGPDEKLTHQTIGKLKYVPNEITPSFFYCRLTSKTKRYAQPKVKKILGHNLGSFGAIPRSLEITQHPFFVWFHLHDLAQ